MLEEYQEALEPKSLLEVVPKEVLQSQMQGFFYGHSAGMVLMYDVGRDAQGRPVLERLEPVELEDPVLDPKKRQDWRVLLKNFNPFCAKFREEKQRNAVCEACEMASALQVFETAQRSRRYYCHLGLIDITIPLRIGGQMRGVISGGQKIIIDDLAMLPRIGESLQRNVTDEGLRSELIHLAYQEAIPGAKVDEFERLFSTFAQTLQTTVDTFYRARIEGSERQTLLKLRHTLDSIATDESQRWRETVGNMLAEFCQISGCGHAWLLELRGSRYRGVTSAQTFSPEVQLPVRLLIETPIGQLHPIADPNSALTEKLGIKSGPGISITLLRVEASVAANDDTSIILLFAGEVAPKYASLVAGIAEAVIKPLGVFDLLDRIQWQQEEIRRDASFTGHHLKTPLQSVMFSLRNLLRSTSDPQVKPIVDRAMLQLKLALADTIRLQSSVSPAVSERVEVFGLFNSIIEDLAPQAAEKNVEVRVMAKTTAQLHVQAVRSELKIALTNLLDNAIKYSFEDKWIAIRLALIKAYNSQGREKANIAIEIEDVGVGFPLEQKERLFSLGTRLDQTTGRWAREGFGIGLVQAKEYIENARGSLDIDSAPDSGGQRYRVTVSILLPYSPS